MFGGMARLIVKPGAKNDVIDFLRWDADVARTEPGTLRFDVWADPDDENALLLYECYTDKRAFEAHQVNEPVKKFVADVVPNLCRRSPSSCRLVMVSSRPLTG